MSDNNIKSIGSVRPPETNLPARAANRSAPAAPQASFQDELILSSRAAGHVRTSAAADQDKAASSVKPKDNSAIQNDQNMADISLHFQVDDKTKELTVFIVDRKSKKVLRSIPAGDLKKLQASDLLKLTA